MLAAEPLNRRVGLPGAECPFLLPRHLACREERTAALHSSLRPPQSSSLISSATAAALLSSGAVDYCLHVLKSLLDYWKSQQNDEEPVTTSQLLKPHTTSSPPDMSPFFLRQYVKVRFPWAAGQNASPVWKAEDVPVVNLSGPNVSFPEPDQKLARERCLPGAALDASHFWWTEKAWGFLQKDIFSHPSFSLGVGRAASHEGRLVPRESRRRATSVGSLRFRPGS